MAKKKKLPLVAICGRPNVGKSTLFNRISKKQRAIIHDEEGITRDRQEAHAEYDGKRFRLVDTGGIVENPIDSILQKMQSQIETALQQARVVVFVVDGQNELTRVDYEVRDHLLTLNKPIVLAVNKLDNDKLELNKTDFYELGVGEPFPISSGHNLGIEEMMDAVIKHIPDAPGELEEEETPRIKVAVVGKPNVGKSSFVNAILNESRTIVDETPGTTRDAIDIEFSWKGHEYTLIDTAGMRKKAGIELGEVEHFSVTRSLRAVRRADVALLMIDATEGIAEQDKRILGYIAEQGIAGIIVWTKWDLVEDKDKKHKELADQSDFHIKQFEYLPTISISSLTRQRIFKVFELIDEVAAESEKRIGTGELNRFMEETKAAHQTPTKHGKAAKINYVTQASVKPTVFVLFVKHKDRIHITYLRYIENQLRAKFGFKGVPINLELREGRPKRD